MLLPSPAPAPGRLALLLTLAGHGADFGCPATPARASRRLLYRFGALYIRLFGLGHGVHLSASSNSEFSIQHSEF